MVDSSSHSTTASPAPAVLHTENISSAYFLHHGDNPSSILVTQPLTGENYHTWSRSMMMALTTKNKVGFVNGTISPPSDSADPLFTAWNRCNSMILSWILNSISKEIASGIIYASSAFEMWHDLKESFSKRNGPRIFHLQQAISSLCQDSLSVSVYYTRLKALWDELQN
ncbi:hypothetical protein F2P56_030057 [Juglans regia]|uniref:Retrotransposon Copia-like N-terminal domain-containing protein n=1 Tax=Juglans regia TaxID=51240 RepID=A0A833WX43_JUGRE|nr:hypothetical protein F2P56_030057 [Juglans regia]